MAVDVIGREIGEQRHIGMKPGVRSIWKLDISST